MPPPPLLRLASEAAYQAHFEKQYVSGPPLMTFDGIRVLFYKNQFRHAFFTASVRGGPKDSFNVTRAERMDWIRWALLESSLEVYRRVMDDGATRRVVLEPSTPYLVTCQLVPTDPKKAVFITAYVVTDRSILPKVRGNPPW